jgi:pantothenate kinase type III
VRGLVEAISRELGATPTVVLTGGLSAAPWAKQIAGVTAIDPLLTLRGLAILHAEVAAALGAARA